MADSIVDIAKAARDASLVLSQATLEQRNAALEAIAAALESNQPALLEANARDMEAAQKLEEAGKLSAPLVKRLKVDADKMVEIVTGVRSVGQQEDPLGKTLRATELDTGLKLYRVSVPIGVIGVIFESRPDALVQIATLCLKSGNAALLKGGSEAIETNRALARVIVEATQGLPGIPDGWMHLMEDRAEVRALLDLHDYVDLIIPRGSNELVQYIMANTKIVVMGHADGICHVYVDEGADLDKALPVCVDAKVQYPAVCNAAETLLVHSAAAERFVPKLVRALREQGVEIRGDETVQSLVSDVVPATEEDWATEYLDLIVSIRVVGSLDDAVAHINRFGSHHTDSILTEDAGAANRFLRAVDSASVVHNASTRFADGYRYGLGAEVGISTNRLHSRGPVGLDGLVIYKYVLLGEGQVAGDYVGPNARPFTHLPLDETWNPER